MHNATSAGVGMAGGAIGTAIAAGFSITPVGWTIGAGLLATWGFNLAYNYNFLGVQDGLDYVGQKLDDVGNWVVDSVEGAGQAISKGIDAINPMNWAW
ncbi:hypothetical protein [Amphibacillus sediminis]|uniref:hypothetical protein n=1 Tax=Amphibacillus sediminis TaxID=360185 RepID=UPI0012EE9490|nr:hypothetical protein [Amphibacillus sediminis]